MQQADQLGIDGRAGGAERFAAELVEFAVAALLDIFVAESRDVVEQADRRGPGSHAVFEVAADDAGGAFGTQGQAAAALVQEGVHFLLDDVGGVADAALEKIGLFKSRDADFLVAVAAADHRQKSVRHIASRQFRPAGCRGSLSVR